ncbi:hypothetical protein [Deinococcus pimensis]|uniref:hypothetical protein n=1 Tax=Deinococcus pimensis TaxID=309888 RepID=UPI000485838C|nr:hypothetical protein [Deinococcus pimensis]
MTPSQGGIFMALAFGAVACGVYGMFVLGRGIPTLVAFALYNVTMRVAHFVTVRRLRSSS